MNYNNNNAQKIDSLMDSENNKSEVVITHYKNPDIGNEVDPWKPVPQFTPYGTNPYQQQQQYYGAAPQYQQPYGVNPQQQYQQPYGMNPQYQQQYYQPQYGMNPQYQQPQYGMNPQQYQQPYGVNPQYQQQYGMNPQQFQQQPYGMNPQQQYQGNNQYNTMPSSANQEFVPDNDSSYDDDIMSDKLRNLLHD